MKIAFYKGTKTGIAGVYNRGVRWVEAGKYSHCEVLFSDGISASSSFIDGGVRFKQIEYDLTKWDIFEIPWADEEEARKYFVLHEGNTYNILGNIRFVFGFIRSSRFSKFCSEACAGAIGLENSWQIAPNCLANIIILINERFNMKHIENTPVNTPTVPDGGDTGNDTLPPKKP